MNAVPKYVFSCNLEHADWVNNTLVKEDAGKAVARLKEQPAKDHFVFGNADLSATLIRHELFDEYGIALVPVTLGGGCPQFKPDSKPLRLQLLQSRPLGERCLLLRYNQAAVAGPRAERTAHVGGRPRPWQPPQARRLPSETGTN